MSKIIRIKKVTRVQNKTMAGVVYYPRVEFSGADIKALGWEFGDKIKVTIDTETGVITIEKAE